MALYLSVPAQYCNYWSSSNITHCNFNNNCRYIHSICLASCMTIWLHYWIRRNKKKSPRCSHSRSGTQSPCGHGMYSAIIVQSVGLESWIPASTARARRKMHHIVLSCGAIVTIPSTTAAWCSGWNKITGVHFANKTGPSSALEIKQLNSHQKASDIAK